MLQQGGTLCIALMRLAQWPNVARGGLRIHLHPTSVAIFGRFLDFPIVTFSSTMVQTQKTNKEELDQDTLLKAKSSTPTLETQNLSVGSAIAQAKTLNELLELVDSRTMSGDNLKNLLAKLAGWELSGVVKGADYQQDPRYIQAQKMAHKPTFIKKVSPKFSGELQEDESVAANTELKAVLKVKSLSRAIELASTFNPKQRVAVLKNLAGCSHRPLPLINSLAYGINKGAESLNMKEVADLLFSMSKLSYINHELLENVCKVMKAQLESTFNHAVIGSAITSLRKLQFKDTELLEQLSLWVEKNMSGFRNPSSFLYLLALQNYLPSNHETLFPIIFNEMKAERGDNSDIISVVWSLVVLQCATVEHVAFILDPSFMDDLSHEPIYVPTAKKLLNLNAAAQILLKNYSGPHLPHDLIDDQKSSESQEKIGLILKVKDLLFHKMDPSLYATSVPTNMGFTIDLLCSLDKDSRPVPLEASSADISRVAVMVLTFRECCSPNNEPIGYKVLEKRLLESQGFKVVQFPYHVFTSEKSSKQYHNFFKNALQNALSKTS